MRLQDYKIVHCIGIGGIGLSAIARYMQHHGAKVSGSDGSHSKITDDLVKEGMQVYIGHDAVHLSPQAELIIYSIAVSGTNPELTLARERGVTCLSYPEALGLLTEEYITIAVCGTHGKTTTTAMIQSMLEAVGESPTIIVGSLLHSGGTNFIQGAGKYLVVEACEYRRSFLNLHPSHVVITNIDEDHLDYYRDIHDIRNAFQEFVEKVPHDGYVVAHNNISLLTKGELVDADSLVDPDTIKLSVLGLHNRQNAQLALTLAKKLGLDEEKAREGLYGFKGTWRRMEGKGSYNGALLYDDYAHHPEEIRATLQAIREKYPHAEYKLVAIFQPHLYSRTKQFLDDFALSFTVADDVYIMPIYASREQADPSITSEMLVKKIAHATYVENFTQMKEIIDEKYSEGTVIVTLGAGDIHLLHQLLG